LNTVLPVALLQSGKQYRAAVMAVCSQDLVLADRSGRFNIDDDRVVNIDQVVG
jgi:hypothetical protein